MERIFELYKNNQIELIDVYAMCKNKLTKRDSLISTCLTLILTSKIPSRMTKKYEKIEDLFWNEQEFIYNLLYDENPMLANKFIKIFGNQVLLHPVEFQFKYYFDD